VAVGVEVDGEEEGEDDESKAARTRLFPGYEGEDGEEDGGDKVDEEGNDKLRKGVACG